MDITIDYSDPVQYVINVPRADLFLLQVSPSEIRQLNIDAFRIILNALMESEEGIPFPTNHEHTPPFTISGVTLARVLNILDPYVIEFEDGLYSVNIVGGNSNLSDKIIKNSVGVNTSNSAGLQDPFALQSGAFSNEVTIWQAGGITGTVFPVGTRGFPVNNLDNALTIAVLRGISTFRILGNLSLSSGDYSLGYRFIADNTVLTTTTIDTAADVTNCEFVNMTVQGVLDNNNTFKECVVLDVDLFQGNINSCGLSGTVVLASGTISKLINCYSAVPGAGLTEYPIIDMGGNVSTDLIVRNYNGNIGVINNSAESSTMSFDMNSGMVILESTITAGQIHVHGVTELWDFSTGTTTIHDHTVVTEISEAIWDKQISEHQIAGSTGEALSNAASDSAATIADAVLKEIVSDHQSVSGSLAESLMIIKGLVQSNFVLDSTNYTGGFLTSARIRIFASGAAVTSATDGGVGQGELASFAVSATPESVGSSDTAMYKVRQL